MVSHDQEMHVGAWRIGVSRGLDEWRSVCERVGDDDDDDSDIAHFGPFQSRERARRVALFHALWLDGLLTEGQAVAMLEGRAEVVEAVAVAGSKHARERAGSLLAELASTERADVVHTSADASTFRPPLGQDITAAVLQMHAIAKSTGRPVNCRFNGINITVRQPSEADR